MISISINDNGEINISQETPGERIYMSRFYAEQENEESQITRDDDARAEFFKQGWDSAIRETQLQYVNGRLEEFFNDVAPKLGTDATDDDGDGEPDSAPNQPLIRPAVDSGEPEKEADTEAYTDHAGRWIIPNEELQALKDAEFERGMAYVSETVPRRYSDAEIASIREEALRRGVSDTLNLKYSAIRGAFDAAVARAEEDVRNWETANPEESRRVQPDHTSIVLHQLFQNLGFEVKP